MWKSGKGGREGGYKTNRDLKTVTVSLCPYIHTGSPQDERERESGEGGGGGSSTARIREKERGGLGAEWRERVEGGSSHRVTSRRGGEDGIGEFNIPHDRERWDGGRERAREREREGGREPGRGKRGEGEREREREGGSRGGGREREREREKAE